MKSLIFTYAMTYGGAIAAIFNPSLGLLAYICFACIKPDALWSYAVPPGNYSRIVAIGLLLGWAFAGFGRWEFGKAGGIVSAIGLYWFWSILSAAFAPDRQLAWPYVESLTKIVLPFIVGITMIESVRRLKQLAWLIVLCHGYLALEFNINYYNGYYNQYREVTLPGMLDRNGVAIAMDSCIGLAFFLGLHATRWWMKAGALLMAGLMVHVVLFSLSRGGMIGLIIVGFVSFLIIPKRPVYYLIFLLAVLVGIRLAGKDVQERFSASFADQSGQRDASAESRLILWANCWDCMLKHPIVGVGPDHWGLVVVDYGWTPNKEAHSLWMQTGAELGFPGILSLLSFYGLCLVRLWPMAREASIVSDPWMRYLARMVIPSIVGFVISAQFVTLEGLEPPYYIVLLGAGTLKLESMPRTASSAILL